jgi:hypothetical protein
VSASRRLSQCKLTDASLTAFGSTATDLQRPRNVRFYSESDRIAVPHYVTLRAITGREQMQQQVCLGVDYSITSSAKMWSIGGIGTPNASAVL